LAQLATRSPSCALATSPSAASLPTAKQPEDVGLSAERLQRIHSMVQRHVDLGDITGGVMGVLRTAANLLHPALSSVSQTEQRIILATGSYIGEGFDGARLGRLFLAMPISWKGTL
jgi:hypothetical protein